MYEKQQGLPFSSRRLIDFPNRLLKASTRPFLGSITHVQTQGAVVALTFDDGPHPESTPRLLDVLAKHGAKATFFMMGIAAASHPQLVRQVAEAGHAIGNHTWDHPSLPLISSRERRQQIQQCAAVLAPYAQPIFRPPYGHLDLSARVDLWRLGYEVIVWSGHAFDWLDHDAQQIASDLSRKLQPGAVVLLHDVLYPPIKRAYAQRAPLIEALDMVLDQVKGSYRFVTVPQLLRQGRPQRRNWYKQGNIDWLNNLNEGDTRQYISRSSPPQTRTQTQLSDDFQDVQLSSGKERGGV